MSDPEVTREMPPVDEVPWGEPKTVERLRAMVQQLDPETRECSTTLWAADEIERLRELLRIVARKSSVSWRPNHLVLISIPAADYRMICEAVVE